MLERDEKRKQDLLAQNFISSAELDSARSALDTALATWGDITFNYESTDTPDVVVTPTTV